MGLNIPFALLRIRAAPESRLKLSPFEIVYGRPLQARVLTSLCSEINHELNVTGYVQNLS